MKNRKKGVVLNSPLDDLAAQASSESVRGPKSMGKHKLKWTQGPKTWENVGSERHLPAKTSSRDSKSSGKLSGLGTHGPSWHLLGPSWSSQRPPMALQETCRSSLKPSLGLPEALPSHQTAIASQQSQACSDQSAMF